MYLHMGILPHSIPYFHKLQILEKIGRENVFKNKKIYTTLTPHTNVALC